jgi:hypothetical protein
MCFGDNWLMRAFRFALRLRARNWTASLCYVAVLVSAIMLVTTWLAIAGPLLRGAMPYIKPQQLVAFSCLKAGRSTGLAWGDIYDLRSASLPAIAGYLPRTWGLQMEPHAHVDTCVERRTPEEFAAHSQRGSSTLLQ